MCRSVNDRAVSPLKNLHALSSTQDDFGYRDDIFPSAIQVGYIAEAHFNANKFVDAAYFEPFYLKEFIALKSAKLVL